MARPLFTDISKRHSRPHASADNPYSESQFKTMKCRLDFPARFGCIEDARLHCHDHAKPGNRRCGVCPADLPEQMREYGERMIESPQG